MTKTKPKNETSPTVAETPGVETDAGLTPEWQQEFMLQSRLERARIPDRFRGKNFGNFKTANKARRDVLQAAEAYVSSFNFQNGSPKGLIMRGVVGCGKTHLAVAILQAIIAKGYTGLYYNMPDLLSDIRATYDDRSPLSEHEILLEVNEPDLLVLDDLGAEKTADWINDRLYLIVNRRYENCRPILVTTNLSMAELGEKLGERIVSRLCELSEHRFPEFPKEDFRKKHMR
ncbi:ATP-binding protein [bacterium]|nr:ATP-binding protein [bacterium]